MEVKSIIERDESRRKRDTYSYPAYYGKGEPLKTQWQWERVTEEEGL